jgi:hypothetical protein
VEWHILLHKFYYAAGLAPGLAAHARHRATCGAWCQLLESWMRE